MRTTGSLREVTRFLREKKPESYFEVESMIDAKKELQYRLASPDAGASGRKSAC